MILGMAYDVWHGLRLSSMACDLQHSVNDVMHGLWPMAEGPVTYKMPMVCAWFMAEGMWCVTYGLWPKGYAPQAMGYGRWPIGYHSMGCGSWPIAYGL